MFGAIRAIYVLEKIGSGDGRSEIIVGAPQFFTPTGGEGKAYVFRICP